MDGIRDPGSGKNFWIQGSKRHRIPDPDPQHGSPVLQVGPLRKHLGPGCARLLSLGHRLCSVCQLESSHFLCTNSAGRVRYCTLYSRGLQFRTFLGHFKRRFTDIGPQKKLFLLSGCLKIFFYFTCMNVKLAKSAMF
jgi:hypothetical protein